MKSALAPAKNITMLPSDKDIVSAASQVHSLTSKKVKVIPTRNVSQCIAAFLALNYDLNFKQNAQAMEIAANRVKTIEITKAVRGPRLDGLEIGKGQFIAIPDHEKLVARGDKAADIILEALAKVGAKRAEIVTLYCSV